MSPLFNQLPMPEDHDEMKVRDVLNTVRNNMKAFRKSLEKFNRKRPVKEIVMQYLNFNIDPRRSTGPKVTTPDVQQRLMDALQELQDAMRDVGEAGGILSDAVEGRDEYGQEEGEYEGEYEEGYRDGYEGEYSGV